MVDDPLTHPKVILAFSHIKALIEQGEDVRQLLEHAIDGRYIPGVTVKQQGLIGIIKNTTEGINGRIAQDAYRRGLNHGIRRGIELGRREARGEIAIYGTVVMEPDR